MITFGHGGDHSRQDAIHRALALSTQFWSDFTSTVQIFQGNVQRRDLLAAEAERARMFALLEDYVDQFLIAGRLISEDSRR